MPKIKYIHQPLKKPYNPLAAVLRGYKYASGKTSEQIAQELGLSASNVRTQMGKPVDQWTIGQLKRYCEAVNCPLEKALAAACEK